MTGTLVALVLAAVLVATATWSIGTGGRRLGSVFAVVAALPVLVAIRDLPRPLINGLLVAVLLGVAAVTVRPLLRGSGPDDRVRRGGGS